MKRGRLIVAKKRENVIDVCGALWVCDMLSSWKRVQQRERSALDDLVKKLVVHVFLEVWEKDGKCCGCVIRYCVSVVWEMLAVNVEKVFQ